MQLGSIILSILGSRALCIHSLNGDRVHYTQHTSKEGLVNS